MASRNNPLQSTVREGPAIEALRRAFDNAFRAAPFLSNEQRDELRGKVCAFVEELKAEGLPAERVIIEVRTIARSVGVGVLDDRVVGDAIRWCIAQYYQGELAE
jgi:hypothetical protein